MALRHLPLPLPLILIIIVGASSKREGQELADRQRANLNARTRTIQATVDLTHFAALRPNKPDNGGFGNLLWHFVEIQGLALATNKRAVFNHAVVNSLFSHPDAATGNQSFDLLSNEAVTDMYEHPDERAVVRYLYPCKLAKTRPFSTFARRIYIHGAFCSILLCSGPSLFFTFASP